MVDLGAHVASKKAALGFPEAWSGFSRSHWNLEVAILGPTRSSTLLLSRHLSVTQSDGSEKHSKKLFDSRSSNRQASGHLSLR